MTRPKRLTVLRSVDTSAAGERVRAEAQGAVMCANCGVREATLRWADALAITHGGGARWCEFCAITAQLAHARERAAEIPRLEARLAALTTQEAEDA